MSKKPFSAASSGNLFNREILKRQYAEITDPLLRRRIEHLIWIARHGEEFRSHMLENLGVASEGTVRPLLRPGENTYPFLAHLLTGEASFAESGRRRLFELASSVAERETTHNVQMHCWCDAFPFGRWLLLADAIWEDEVFSSGDREYLQERFLYYLWAHPFQRLKARAIEGTPCNNQNAAMAVACVAGGYLFGQKHARDPRALEMLHLGLPHLQKFLTAFPGHGYSLEGSTYMAGVNALIIPLALELVRASTGEDLLDCSEVGDCATLRETLESVMRLSSPSGLLHPWDNYGYSRANFTPAAAYLAMRTGDFRPLRFLESIGTLELPGHFGWGFDKTFWTLLWTLQAGAPAQTGEWPFSFQQPRLCATAAGPQKKLFVLQMWDESSAPPFRSHFNPNSIILEYDGAPLLLDGRCVEVAKSDIFARPEYQVYKADTDKMLTAGPGTVGAHNTVFFDADEHYYPPNGSSGKICFHRCEEDVCLFESDVTDGFRDGYDVSMVRRAVLTLGDDAVLVRDRIQFHTQHKVTWRAHVRDGASCVRDAYFRVHSPDHAVLEICLPDGGALECRRFEGNEDEESVPGQFENACHEISHHAHGRDVVLHTLIAVSPGLEPLQTLQSEWQWQVAADESEAERLRGDWSDARFTDFSAHSWFYTTERDEPGIGLFRREFELASPVPSSVWLRLPPLPRSSTIWINGKQRRITIEAQTPSLTPHFLPIESLLRPGKNELILVSPSTLETALRGEIVLMIPTPQKPDAALKKIGEPGQDRWELRYGGQSAIVEWDDAVCSVEREDGRVLRIPLTPSEPLPRRQPKPVPALVPPVTPVRGENPDLLAEAIRSADWRVALDALERAKGMVDPVVVHAAWEMLLKETQTHETSPRRSSDDLSWYRLKAAAIRVLGGAAFEPATALLGEQLLDTTIMYPVRAASAEALGRIGTQQALEYLERLPDFDEHNTRLTVARVLENASRNGCATASLST